MKSKKLLVSILVSTLIITSFQSGVFAYAPSVGTKILRDTETDTEEEKSNNTGYNKNNFKFVINQGVLAARDDSCWTCAQEAIVQNSGCLKDTGYQMTGVVKTSSHEGWANWSKAMGVSPTARGGVSFGAVEKSNALCKDIGQWTLGTGTDMDTQKGTNNAAYVIGWNNNGTIQYIKDMSEEQLKTMFKAFYNNGYWLTVGLRDYINPGYYAKPNGTKDEFASNHTVMFAGMDNDTIMVLDSASYKEGDGSKVSDYVYDISLSYSMYNKGSKPHNVVYVMAFKFSDEKYSLLNVCGGKEVTMSTTDQTNLANMGIQDKKGHFTEEQLSSMVVLSEADLAGVLDYATTDNLTHEDLESLDIWKNLVAEESTTERTIRIVVQLVGVLLLIWSILLFTGYYFDRINNLIDISAVSILTLGKLRAITDDGEEATFGKDKSEKKNKISTVNSRNIFTICSVTALFAVLILTGTLYNMLTSLVNLVKSILWR